MTKFNFTPATIRAMNSGNFEDIIAASSPGGIEAQEARGQRDFVNKQILPRDIRSGRDSGQEIYEKMGITIINQADDLFFNVNLPQGWTKRGSDHAMWSYVDDEQGRERLAIFYKAAFYDRSAHASPSTRYRTNYEPVGGWNSRLEDSEYIATAFDASTVIWQSEPVQDNLHPYPWSPQTLAQEWLDQNYPDWRNPFAYWSE